VENCSVICAMHGWEFDLKTGACKNIPGQEVRTYEVRIVNLQVQVALPSV
jgi:nitrite reductase/ring-hydroxylating ferredoxin subunit